MVPVFPGILPASMDVAPYSPSALASVRIVPATSPGPADGTATFQKILYSGIPSVLAAWIRFTSICSNAALAFLYISGNAITVAAMIQPAQVCTTLMPNCSYSRIPNGRLLLNRRSRKNPAAVGGSTIGSVRIPSAIAFTFGPALITFLAANRPRKNENIVATIPVFNDTYNGL